MTKKAIVRKTSRLQERLSELQADIYAFASELEELGRSDLYEHASNAGFELNKSQSEMEDIIDAFAYDISGDTDVGKEKG